MRTNRHDNSQSEPPAVTIRAATLDDAAALVDIYNREIPSLITFDMIPRTLATKRMWLADHGGAHPALVAESSAGVVGFASLAPYRDRPAYATTVENSIYVAQAARGLGVGRQLLSELLQSAASHGFHCVVARIVADNEPSLRLHASLGFRFVGRELEVGRKHGRWLDVISMQRLLRDDSLQP
jgi:phosphinothricin acetyltransferase